MIGCATLLLAASILSAAPPGGDAPLADDQHSSARAPTGAQSAESQSELPRVLTLGDAPTTPGQSFGASALTSFTGLVILGTLGTGPTRGLPMSNFTLQARIATSLLLLSVGPSMGDLMNHDGAGFLAGAGGRTLLVALGWGAVALARVGGAQVVTAGSVLFVTLGALVWIGWGATDLVRSLFAPERWVDRQNRLRPSAGVRDPTREAALDERRF